MVLRFFLFVGALLFVSCTDVERDSPYDPESRYYIGVSSSSKLGGSSSSSNPSSSSASVKNYCVYAEIEQCYFGLYSACPGVGGELADSCPYGSSSSAAASSSSPWVGGSSSSQAAQSSSSEALPEYGYCVFISDKVCLAGPMSICPPGGTLSNSCPYSSSSSAEVSSSSTAAPSSSSNAISSSSFVVRSSSSAEVSSSSVMPRCGNNVEYNPATEQCCGTNKYVTTTQFCIGTTIYNKCGGITEYNPATEQCCGIDKYITAAEQCCGINKYVTAIQFCIGTTIYSKCGGIAEYNPVTEQCCGINKYVTATQFCYNSSKIGNFCGSNPQKSYDPDLYECKPNSNGIHLKGEIKYEGETYDAVLIGTQIWMAKNLNYNATGSKCYGDNTTNCAIYGRLYDRATAMTVCHTGWHLPSNAEWTTLSDFVGYSAGIKLRSTSGWNSYDGQSSNGTDDFGFTALPGGSNSEAMGFSSVGYSGYWWSTSVDNGNAVFWYMSYNNDALNKGNGNVCTKSCSVRCVRD